MIGNVETLDPALPATVSTNIDEEQNVVYFNFGIPKGDKGDTGDTNLVSFEIENGMLKAYDEQGNIYNLGMVAIEPKGEYSATTSYEKLNTVLYNDSTYMALKSTLGNLPTNTDYWQLIGGGLQKQDIIDNLNSNDAEKMLSAKQGKVIDGKKPTIYENVASMIADTSLKNGMTAQTLGYYSANDGGGATYKITNIQSTSEHQEEVGTLYATLIIENEVNIKQLGAYGDNIHDDTSIINDAINKFNNVFFPESSYKITDTITINGNKNIKCLGNIVSYVARTKPAILIKNRYNNIEFKDIVDQNSYENVGYNEGWHGWEDSNYCAIELQDFSYSILEFNKIANFTTGLKITGLTVAGTYKMKVIGYEIFNCRYGIYFKTLLNSWVNNNFIEKIMINYGSAGTFRTNCNPIQSYGVYQENVADDKYGIQYFEFNNLFFETSYKDNFTAFYFNLIANSNFNMCIPETKDNSVFALFDMKYIVENPVAPQNHSYKNIFNECYVMGGNNTITYNNTSKIVCSLVDVAKHSDIKLNKIYEENNLLGKMVKIDNNHMSIKGYAFAPINATATNINTCQESKSNYSYITNQWNENCLSIGSTTPLSMILPCSLNDTFKIVLNEKGNSGATNGSIAFKVFDSTGAILTDPSNYEKALGGYFAYFATTKNYSALSGQLNDVEISVLDSNVAYILVYISGYVNGFNIYKYGKPTIAKKFGDNLKHLYLLGDVAFSNVKPTSTADTDSVIKNQRVYNSNVANLGEYWTFDGTAWN